MTLFNLTLILIAIAVIGMLAIFGIGVMLISLYATEIKGTPKNKLDTPEFKHAVELYNRRASTWNSDSSL